MVRFAKYSSKESWVMVAELDYMPHIFLQVLIPFKGLLNNNTEVGNATLESTWALIFNPFHYYSPCFIFICMLLSSIRLFGCPVMGGPSCGEWWILAGARSVKVKGWNDRVVFLYVSSWYPTYQKREIFIFLLSKQEDRILQQRRVPVEQAAVVPPVHISF